MKTKIMLSILLVGLMTAILGTGKVEAKGRGEGAQNHPRFQQLKEKFQNLHPHWRRNARKGKVISISSNKITLQAINKPLSMEITIDSDTKYFNKNHEALTLADIKIGDEVHVGGVRWDKDGKIFGPARVVKTMNK